MNYLDTTALVRAARLKLAPHGITRTHTLAEFYSTFTGAGVVSIVDGKEIKEKLSPADTVTRARKTFANVKFEDLDTDTVFEALEKAVRLNVQGRNIHDYLHCAAAEKSGCKKIVTMNFSDFSMMTHLPLVSPAKQFSEQIV